MSRKTQRYSKEFKAEAVTSRAPGSRARYVRSPQRYGPVAIPCRRSSHTSLSSPGAAGKLLHILVEGLRRELQPFDHRQVGEQLVGQFLHRHPVANRQCGRLDQFARFRGHCSALNSLE